MIRIPQPRRVPGWLVLAWCAVLGIPSPATAQVPPPSREELMRKWDLDRDGKVDASETEAARSQMRRARNESLMKSGIDPVTGRARVPSDPVTGRPFDTKAAANDPPQGRGGSSAAADDGGLILVPGTGDPVEGLVGPPSGPSRSTQQERPALPGTRVPMTSSTVPSVVPQISPGGAAPGPQAGTSGRDFGGRDLSSRARMLPGAPPSQNPQLTPGPRDPRSRAASVERQPAVGERPGIISGGVRAGGAAARPGYGAGGPPQDLNAGRLPGGLPQTRGVVPGTSGVPRSGATAPPGAGRLAGPGQATARTGMPQYRGPAAPAMPSTGGPSTPRPMLRQPDGGRPSSPIPGTAPRVPRVSSDDFYGR